MNILFLSNYFNHHQKPFCEAMFQRLGDGYRFIATEEMSEERKQLGWGGIDCPPYVLEWNAETKDEIQSMIDSADAVIIGSAPYKLIRNRLRQNKLTFRYAERPCKQKPPFWKYLARQIVWRLRHPANKPLYMLCASAYTASDYAAYGCFKGKCYKWGYFPETRQYDDVDRLIAEKQPNSLLWVARFIDLKHPEVAVTVAKRLKEAGYIFELNMIGNGVLLNSMRELAEAEGVSDCLHLLGSMPPEAVREHMEKSEIFLFTSDRNEGWGAVLNESMNSACAVVADDAIGSVPFLVTEGENGLTYKTGDIETVVEKIKYLLDHPAERIQMAKKAYLTIVTEWNAEVAAEKLIKLITIKRNSDHDNCAVQGVCSLTD